MALRSDAKVERLARIPLFAHCSKRDLREIARVTEEVEYEAGAVLIREGEPGHEFYVLLNGRLDVSRRRKGVVAAVEAGDFVGETALLSNRPRNATVTAVAAVTLLRIQDRDFLALLDRMPLLWLKIAGSLADRLPDDELVLG
jgi:CRP-like cAMP-binding protein